MKHFFSILTFILLLMVFSCQKEEEVPIENSAKYKGLNMTKSQQDRFDFILDKYVDPKGRHEGATLKFNSFEEMDNYFKRIENKDFPAAGKMAVKQSNENRLLSARIEDIDFTGFSSVSATFVNFGPSRMNMYVRVSSQSSGGILFGQSSVSISPYGYYGGTFNSTISNVITTANNVSFHAEMTTTTSIEILGTYIGTTTQVMGANFNYNSSTQVMSYTVTSSHGYE